MNILEYHQKVDYLKRACIAYYQGKPFIPDIEYDIQYKELLQYEKDHPNEISKDSPTQKIYAPKGKVKHLKKMMSLESVDTFEELQDWVRKRKLPPDTRFHIEPKFDGMAIELIYVDGILKTISTRGDGDWGQDITHNYYLFHNIPKKLSKVFYRMILGIGKKPPKVLYKDTTIAIYGEALFCSKLLQTLDKNITDLNLRNKVSGLLLSKHKQSEYTGLVEFVPYDIEYPNVNNYYDQDNKLRMAIDIGSFDWEWASTRIGRMAIDLEGIKNFYDYQCGHRACDLSNQKYNTVDKDGIVIKINDLELQNELGYGVKSARYMVAWKFPAIVVSTYLVEVKWAIGPTGLVTPTGVLDPPCEFDTVVVTKVNLHSAKNIKDKGLMLNREVDVARLKDVIPGIVDVRSTKEELPIQIPTHCPSCNELLEVQKVHLKCNNPNCRTKLIKKIALELNGLKVVGISEKTVEKLFDHLMAKDTKAVVSLSLHVLQAILGTKNGTKLYDQFQTLFKGGYS